MLGVGQEVRALHVRLETADHDVTLARPVGDVEIECVALARGLSPRLHGETALLGAVNGFAVHLHPRADAVEDGDVARVELARAHGADVEQDVAAASGRLGEQVDEVGRRLVRVVLLVPAV